jgi:hypothetical protein
MVAEARATGGLNLAVRGENQQFIRPDLPPEPIDGRTVLFQQRERSRAGRCFSILLQVASEPTTRHQQAIDHDLDNLVAGFRAAELMEIGFPLSGQGCQLFKAVERSRQQNLVFECPGHSSITNQ